jgi:hypothetical protein
LARGTILGFPTSYVVIALLVCAYFYVPAFNTAVSDLWNSLTGLSAVPGMQGGTYKGNVNFVETVQDTLTGDGTFNPTNDAYTYFADMPADMSGGTALTAAGHTLGADDDGECWIAFGGVGVTDAYFDVAQFNAKNSKWILSGGFWADLADDNSPEYVAHIDTSHAGITGQAQTPVINLVAPWLDLDTTVTLSSPADYDNAGATEVVAPITWTITGVTADDGFYISRIRVTVNGTIASGLLKPEELMISNGLGAGGVSFIAQPVAEVEGATAEWYYLNGSPDYRHYFNCEPYQIKTGEAATIYITINFRVDLVAGANVTFYLDLVGSDGTITSSNDGGTAINIIS